MSKSRILLLAAAALILAGRAMAAEPAAPPAPKTQVPLVLTIEDEALSLWENTKSALGSFFSMFVPPSPVELAGRIESQESEFWSMLSDAGYQITEVESSVGLIPDVSATFQLVREMSEADREFLERRLDSHAKRDGGVIARLQRSILRVILEAAEGGSYQIETVEVVMLPLPKARFVLTPVNGVMDPDHIVILRAIDQLKKKTF